MAHNPKVRDPSPAPRVIVHLSRIDVHDGDMVERMGTSVQTGMAGGDHPHFSVQLDGVHVDPKKWWVSHWIKNHTAKRPGGRKFKLLPNMSMANHFILGGS